MQEFMNVYNKSISLLSVEFGRPPLLRTLSYFAGIIGLSSSIYFDILNIPSCLNILKTRMVMGFSYFGEKGLKIR